MGSQVCYASLGTRPGAPSSAFPPGARTGRSDRPAGNPAFQPGYRPEPGGLPADSHRCRPGAAAPADAAPSSPAGGRSWRPGGGEPCPDRFPFQLLGASLFPCMTGQQVLRRRVWRQGGGRRDGLATRHAAGLADGATCSQQKMNCPDGRCRMPTGWAVTPSPNGYGIATRSAGLETRRGRMT